MKLGRAKEKSGHGEMNYKRKHSSYRKYRYFRRGWYGHGIMKIRKGLPAGYTAIAEELKRQGVFETVLDEGDHIHTEVAPSWRPA